MSPTNILLVYPQPNENKECRFGFSLNLLYLGAILENAGHAVHYLDYSLENFNQQSFLRQVSQAQVTIFEFDAFSLKRSLNFSHGEDLICTIRKYSLKTKIIVFGNDIILNQRILSLADFTFFGEAETHIENVVRDLLNNKTPYVNYLENKNNFDQLPFPARHLLSPWIESGGNLLRPPHLAKSTLIQTSRGCQNTCRFCQRQGWYGKFQAHSLSYSIQEFREIHDQGYKNIWITDDNFCFDIERSKALLHRIGKEVNKGSCKIALSTWTRIDLETIDLFLEAGVSVISMGIESTDDEILRFYAKSIDLDQVVDIVTYADSVGIYCIGNFIIGAPTESEHTIASTLSFAKNLPFDQVNVKILDYMIGSPLFATLPKHLVKDRRHIFACRENGLCNFSLEELRQKTDEFTKTVSESRRRALHKKICQYGPPYFTLPSV